MPLSSDELAEVLTHAGFRRSRRTATVIWLERTGTAVAIPIADVIPIETLTQILRDAHMSATELAAGLDALERKR